MFWYIIWLLSAQVAQRITFACNFLQIWWTWVIKSFPCSFSHLTFSYYLLWLPLHGILMFGDFWNLCVKVCRCSRCSWLLWFPSWEPSCPLWTSWWGCRWRRRDLVLLLGTHCHYRATYSIIGRLCSSIARFDLRRWRQWGASARMNSGGIVLNPINYYSKIYLMPVRKSWRAILWTMMAALFSCPFVFRLSRTTSRTFTASAISYSPDSYLCSWASWRHYSLLNPSTLSFSNGSHGNQHLHYSYFPISLLSSCDLLCLP